MSQDNLIEQQTKLKAMILSAFDNQFGGNVKDMEWSIAYNRLSKDVILSLTLVTNKTSDFARIQFDVKKIGYATNIGPFKLQLKKNGGAGKLNDELFVSEGEVLKEEFPDVFNYLYSEEFKKLQRTPPRIRTAGGKVLMTVSGNPIETQR